MISKILQKVVSWFKPAPQEQIAVEPVIQNENWPFPTGPRPEADEIKSAPAVPVKKRRKPRKKPDPK